MDITADLPFPEPTEAILYQLHLVKLGLKPCVLIPHYAPKCPIEEKDFVITPTARGCLVHLPTLSRATINRSLHKAPGLLFGYGIPNRPVIGPLWASCLFTSDGQELLSVCVNSETYPIVEANLHRYKSATSHLGVILTSKSIPEIINLRLDYWKKHYNKTN